MIRSKEIKNDKLIIFYNSKKFKGHKNINFTAKTIKTIKKNAKQ